MSDTTTGILLLRNERSELVVDSETKRGFASRYGQYLVDVCDRTGPETVVQAAKKDAERELTTRVWRSGRSYASCWVELMRDDTMREWYRLAQLSPERDDHPRFTRIVRFRDIGNRP